MQGKLDSSHSKSTSLVRVVTWFAPDPRRLPRLLLNGQVGSYCPRTDFNRLRGDFAVFAPSLQRVFARRNILDLVVATLVRNGKIGRRREDDVSIHFRVDVAEQASHTNIVKLEALLLSLWPRAEVVGEFLVATDTGPIHVVAYRIAVQEFHRGSGLHHHHVWRKGHLGLVHDRFRCRSVEFLVRDRIDIYRNVFRRLEPLYSDLPFDVSRQTRPCQQERGAAHCYCLNRKSK